MISKEVFELQSRLCQAMSHSIRLEIVHILRDGPRNVNALAQAMGLSQPTISRHLAILKNLGLVTAQHQGQENFYQLANPKIVVVCDLMRQVLAEQISQQVEAADLET